MVDIWPQSVFRHIVTNQFMKMFDKPFYIDFFWVSLHQPHAVLEINSGSSHQLTGYQVIIIQDTNIKMREFPQDGVPTLLKRGIHQFRCVYIVTKKNVETKIFSIPFPSGSGYLFVA